jgi:hypothetical protein
MRFLIIITLAGALLAGCASTEPPRTVELAHADPSIVLEQLKVAYEGCEVVSEGRTLSIRRGSSPAALDELETYVRACDDQAARNEVRELKPGVTTIHEIVRLFARARGISMAVDAQTADARIEVVAFAPGPTVGEAWATAKKILELRGARCQELPRAVQVMPAGILATDWTPAAVAAVASHTRAASAVLELEGDVVLGEGHPTRSGGVTLGAALGSRVVLVGEKAAVGGAVDTLRALDALPWAEGEVFFTLTCAPDAKGATASILEKRAGARVVAGHGRRIGVLVTREREREAREAARAASGSTAPPPSSSSSSSSSASPSSSSKKDE